jgi:hypothetical protein
MFIACKSLNSAISIKILNIILTNNIAFLQKKNNITHLNTSDMIGTKKEAEQGIFERLTIARHRKKRTDENGEKPSMESGKS